jgi:hypothetical protein
MMASENDFVRLGDRLDSLDDEFFDGKLEDEIKERLLQYVDGHREKFRS